MDIGENEIFFKTKQGRAQSPSATIFKRKLFMPKTYQHLQLEERA
jgi:hypothetical protein